MEIQVDIAKNEYIWLNIKTLMRKPAMLLIFIAFPPLLVFIMNRETPPQLTIILPTLAFIWFCLGYSLFRAFGKSYQKNVTHFANMIWNIDSSMLNVTSNNQSYRFPWSAITRFQLGVKGVSITVEDRQVFFIPERCISEADKTTLLMLARQNNVVI